ncbi:MAG: nicotinate phosphoribosyltransferase [Chromatocurvus sp.]
MIDITGTWTDQYQLTMAQAYFQEGRAEETAVFDYFFRKLPFDGGYATFAGLEDLLDTLSALQFSSVDIDYLAKQGFNAGFLDWLREFRFRGSVRAVLEGDLVFPNRPVLEIEAPLVEGQVVESLLLNILNLQTLVATKASRMRLAAGRQRKLVDFGMRRAHGAGGYAASRAAIIGGFDGTSNVRAARDYGLPLSGTMAHSFIQSYDHELDAFRAFARCWPENCVLLVDTYDTLKSGVPNAITVGLEMAEQGSALKGIRLDSGDLAWLGRESRRLLDEAGLSDVRIAASNELDEHVIKSLIEQRAPIDLFGVGTRLVTGQPDAAFDGVYKLAMVGGKLRLKLSETRDKVTLPGRKQVWRVADSDGAWLGADVVGLEDEDAPARMTDPRDSRRSLELSRCDRTPLLQTVMSNGERVSPARPVDEIALHVRDQLAALPPEYKRFDNPHVYKIGVSDALLQARDALIAHYTVRNTP